MHDLKLRKLLNEVNVLTLRKYTEKINIYPLPTHPERGLVRNTIDVLSARAGFVVIDTHARNKEQPPSAGRSARVSPLSSSLSHRSTAGASGRRSAAHGKTTLFYCLDIYVNMLFIIGVKDHLRCFADLPL